MVVQIESSNAGEVSEDGYGQDGLLGKKREVIVTPSKLQMNKNEIQDKKVQGRKKLLIPCCSWYFRPV